MDFDVILLGEAEIHASDSIVRYLSKIPNTLRIERSLLFALETGGDGVLYPQQRISNGGAGGTVAQTLLDELFCTLWHRELNVALRDDQVEFGGAPVDAQAAFSGGDGRLIVAGVVLSPRLISEARNSRVG